MKMLYDADIELGKSILDYQTVEEDRNKTKSHLERALQGEYLLEEAFSGEEIRTLCFFEVSHNPIRNSEGKVIGVVFSRDITARS